MELKFSLFQNKKTNDKQPDYRGNVEIEGVAHSVAGWERKDKNGKSYISCVLQVDNYQPKKAKVEEDPLTNTEEGDPFSPL